MNRFQQKFQQSAINSNLTEDSSDYINSDIEVSNPLSHGSNLKDNSLVMNHLASNLADDSNDSFIYDKDNDSSSNFSYLNLGDKRLKLQKTPQPKQQVDKTRLAECLDYLHRMIGRKDKEDIFQLPVTDAIAPGYSTIIKNPMDLSTMRKKIDTLVYNSVTEYRDDLILMCENCMTYNKSDTIYYHAARKMLDYGLKLLSRDKLLSLRHTIRIMRYLTSAEIGFSLENDTPTADDPNPQLIRQRAQQTQQKSFSAQYTSRIGPNNNIIITKSKLFQKLDPLHPPKDSYLVSPEGEDVQDDDLAEEVKELANAAAQRLASKNKNGKMGFLRRNSNGTIGYNFLKNSGQPNDSTESQPSEKSVTIGNLCEGLQPNSYSMASFSEDRKNKAKSMYYLENGPFSSHAPVNDSTYSNLSKEDLDILLTTYGDETAYQYALSLMDFSKGTGFMFNKYVNLVLNTLTNNEHEKYLQHLNTKKQQQQQNGISQTNENIKIEPKTEQVEQVNTTNTISNKTN